MRVPCEDSVPGKAASHTAEKGPEEESSYSPELFDAVQSHVVQAAFALFQNCNHSSDLLSVPSSCLPRYLIL